MSKKAIIFVDANNWYHNVKKTFRPGDIDIEKISKVTNIINKSSRDPIGSLGIMLK